MANIEKCSSAPAPEPAAELCRPVQDGVENGPRLEGEAVLSVLRTQFDPARAEAVARFFKTGPGQYGEGDRFVGLTVPQVRALAREFRGLPLPDLQFLLDDPIHEARLLALTILVERYRKGAADEREAIYRLYLDRLDRVNNWDLVDASAPGIVGLHLLRRDRAILDELAASPALWHRRVAMLATFAFIRAGEFEPTLTLCERLIGDPHDLIHKACGWMLREIGKRDSATLEAWLEAHGHVLPRTALRYAIERMPPDRRAYFMVLGTQKKNRAAS